MSIVEPTPTPNGELVFYVEMTPLQVVEAISIAETEAEERHAKELQELKDKAIEAFKNVMFDVSLESKINNFIHQDYQLDVFTQKLNER